MKTINLKVGDELVVNFHKEALIIKEIYTEPVAVANSECRGPEVFVQFTDGTYAEADDLDYLLKVNGEDITNCQIVIDGEVANEN